MADKNQKTKLEKDREKARFPEEHLLRAKEEFNNFLQWLFFFNNGKIQENLKHAQSKMLKYNHLVANLVILHNTNAMTKAIKKMKREGFKVTPEMLSGTAPYRTGHIDLLGSGADLVRCRSTGSS